MFRKVAYITVTAAVIGAGAFNAFPVSAQVPTSETMTITSNGQNQDMDSQMNTMMGSSAYQAMTTEEMNTQMANVMGSNHRPMSTQQMDTQMANMMGSGNHEAMDGDYNPMMNRDMSGDTPTSTMGRQGR
ncbi:MAG: hypothetical protein JJE47_15020 [Acidimicrobiia bacterium]|nr:hypothetical protein [Acidimicrobiia bacterium]